VVSGAISKGHFPICRPSGPRLVSRGSPTMSFLSVARCEAPLNELL
jgi:hypothetical protein